jgi:hypothetical protein
MQAILYWQCLKNEMPSQYGVLKTTKKSSLMKFANHNFLTDIKIYNPSDFQNELNAG